MLRIIPTKETLTVEFKSDVKKYPDSEIFDAVVAFANTQGGSLYLGVEDDGEITGAHKEHMNPITLSAYVANNTVPPVSIRAELIDECHPVLRIDVPQSHSGIVATSSGKVLRRRLKADGTPENVPMYPTEMATRLSDIRLLDYSAMPLYEATVDDFDLLEVERLRQVVVLNILKDIPRSDVHQLAEAVQLPETIVRTILEKSVETGLVEAYGSGRGRNYSLAKTVYGDRSRKAGYVLQQDIEETRHAELVITLARNNEFVSRADVVQLLHVNEDKAYRLLKQLTEDNVLELVNKGRYSKYRLKKVIHLTRLDAR